MKIISLQLEIFIIIIIIGYIFARKGIITKEVRKKLTDIVIDLILPCAIIKSFMMKLTPEIIRDTVIIFIVSFVIQLSYSVFNRIFYNRFDDSKAIILKYATIVSNTGFMGLSIVESNWFIICFNCFNTAKNLYVECGFIIIYTNRF